MNAQALSIVALVAVTLLWGQSYTANQIALRQLQPAEVMVLRFAIASLCLTPFLFTARRHFRSLTPRIFGLSLLTGLSGLAGFNLCLTYGQSLGTPAGLAGVLVSTSPIFTAILARLVYGEHIPARRVVGLVVAFAGVALVVASKGAVGGASLLGPLLLLGAPFFMALGGILSKIVNRAVPPLFSLAIGLWAVTIGLLPLLPATRLPGVLGTLSPSTWGAILFIAVACTALAYALWYWGFTKMPAAKAGAFAYLTPLFGLGAAFVVLGERPTPLQAAGIALVIAGLASDLVPWRAKAIAPALDTTGHS
ncbi:DMT family transporter [bacterium]|nr:DMT family transporter [bacterium]